MYRQYNPLLAGKSLVLSGDNSPAPVSQESPSRTPINSPGPTSAHGYMAALLALQQKQKRSSQRSNSFSNTPSSSPTLQLEHDEKHNHDPNGEVVVQNPLKQLLHAQAQKAALRQARHGRRKKRSLSHRKKKGLIHSFSSPASYTQEPMPMLFTSSSDSSTTLNRNEAFTFDSREFTAPRRKFSVPDTHLFPFEDIIEEDNQSSGTSSTASSQATTPRGGCSRWRGSSTEYDSDNGDDLSEIVHQMTL